MAFALQFFRQRPEPFELILPQCPRLVPADEHLEHDAAIEVEERDERRGFTHERPLDEGDRRASLVPEMTMQAFRLHQVEIAAADLAGRDRAGEFEDRVVGVHDQRHLAPLRDILHRRRKSATICDTNHRQWQRFDHGARRDLPLPRNVLDHGTRILRHMRPEIRKLRTRHETVLPRTDILSIARPQAAALDLRSLWITSNPSNLGWPR